MDEEEDDSSFFPAHLTGYLYTNSVKHDEARRVLCIYAATVLMGTGSDDTLSVAKSIEMYIKGEEKPKLQKVK